MHPIRVAIADDNYIFRRGLSNALSSDPEILIVGEAINGREAITLIEEQKTDVVIIDIEMPVMNGIEATAIISKRFPGVNTIALSMYDDEILIENMFSVGAKSYLLKNEDKEDIIKAIKTIHQTGACYYNKNKKRKLTIDVLQPSLKDFNSFSEKELSVMKLACEEYSSKEIADRLDASISSIEHTKERIQYKIGAKNMVGIALFAVRKLIVPFRDINKRKN